MSYRVDADVSDCSYGCTYAKQKDPALLKVFTQNIRIHFFDRAKQAVWAVSNCKSTFRIKFGLALKDYFPIKVVGKCGTYFDDSQGIFTSIKRLFQTTPDCGRNSDCESKLFTENKFYLSFESRNCSDYLTEKFWRILRTNMIPVVIQPSKENYNLIAPPNSFIHAQDFDYDAKKLAQHLELVSNDFNIYLKYHLWRLDYESVYSSKMSEKRRLCELCTKLNTETSIVYYDKITSWFNSACFS